MDNHKFTKLDLNLYTLKNKQIFELLVDVPIYFGNSWEKEPTFREKMYILDRRISFFIKNGFSENEIIKILTIEK